MQFRAPVPLIPASPPQMAYPQLHQKPLLSNSLGKIYEKASVVICKEESWNMRGLKSYMPRFPTLEQG